MKKNINEKYFNFNKMNWRIKWYSNKWSKNIVIPSKIDWRTVKEIWPDAFENNHLTNINIPGMYNKKT